MPKTGLAEGTCSRCGRVWRAPRPAEAILCDCYMFCPNDHGKGAYGTKMDPYMPDLTPSIYASIMGDNLGDTDNPINVFYKCPVCGYYSTAVPIEVKLS